MSKKNEIVSDKELQNDYRISAYLRGEMTDYEEDAFFNDLKSDGERAAQAVSAAYFSKAAKEVGEKEDDDVKEALLSISRDDARSIAANTIRRTKARPLHRRIIMAVSIAASVLILFAVGVQYYNYSRITGLSEEYSSAFPVEQSQSRGQEGGEAAKELLVLFNNVKSGTDLDATISRLSVLWELSTMETYNDYTDYSTDIGWNLAIACLKDNDAATAKSVLTKLASVTEPGSAVNAKAKELLMKLN